MGKPGLLALLLVVLVLLVGESLKLLPQDLYVALLGRLLGGRLRLRLRARARLRLRARARLRLRARARRRLRARASRAPWSRARRVRAEQEKAVGSGRVRAWASAWTAAEGGCLRMPPRLPPRGRAHGMHMGRGMCMVCAG